MAKDFIRICEDPELELVKTVHDGGATINVYIKRESEEVKAKNRQNLKDFFAKLGYDAKIPSLNI